ncbi:MAG: alpha/beta-type small acid-soluble spore protein [Limnochordales bacterium]|nr:alpha/beta-type small acid-soluble spore protein [Limnochordales bacterium]
MVAGADQEPTRNTPDPGVDGPAAGAAGVRKVRESVRKAGASASAQEDALDALKWEVAERLGLDDDLQNPDELTVREAGKIGGQMVRELIEQGKEVIAEDQGQSAKRTARRSGQP